MRDLFDLWLDIMPLLCVGAMAVTTVWVVGNALIAKVRAHRQKKETRASEKKVTFALDDIPLLSLNTKGFKLHRENFPDWTPEEFGERLLHCLIFFPYPLDVTQCMLIQSPPLFSIYKNKFSLHLENFEDFTPDEFAERFLQWLDRCHEEGDNPQETRASLGREELSIPISVSLPEPDPSKGIQFYAEDTLLLTLNKKGIHLHRENFEDFTPEDFVERFIECLHHAQLLP